jgi:hypothetical protein
MGEVIQLSVAPFVKVSHLKSGECRNRPRYGCGNVLLGAECALLLVHAHRHISTEEPCQVIVTYLICEYAKVLVAR